MVDKALLDMVYESGFEDGRKAGLKEWQERPTPDGWIPVCARRPDTHRASMSGKAFRSDYVLVKGGDGRYFVGALWLRADDGAMCWVPAYTHTHIDLTDADLWAPLGRVG